MSSGPNPSRVYVPFGAAGAIAAGIVAVPFFVAPEDLEILFAMAVVGTAPTGAAAIFNFQIARADASGNVLAYNNAGSPDVRPTVAIGGTRTYAEVAETFPAGSWPKPGPYALNNAQPGGAVATAPNYTGTSVLTGAGIPAPDLNPVVFAGDTIALDIVQVGSTVAGANLAGTLVLQKR